MMPEHLEKPVRTPRYTIGVGDSNWSIAWYGCVEFLRSHQYLRPAVIIFDFILALLLLYGVSLHAISGFFAGFYLVSFFPTLLWAATVSGHDFQLVLVQAKASEERQTAEKKFEASNTPEDALNLDFTRLNEYYVINQAQARSSFRWAIFSMLLGFGTIIAGIWLFYFRGSQPDKFMASLSTAAGVVVNLISVLFLFLYSKTQERSLFYYGHLSRLKSVSLAMRLVEEHKDAKEQSDARNLVIHCLLSEATSVQAAPPSKE
jgi:hypothetical protein